MTIPFRDIAKAISELTFQATDVHLTDQHLKFYFQQQQKHSPEHWFYYRVDPKSEVGWPDVCAYVHESPSVFQEQSLFALQQKKTTREKTKRGGGRMYRNVFKDFGLVNCFF